MADFEVGVQYLKPVQEIIQMTGLEYALIRNDNVNLFVVHVGNLLFEPNLFEVQHHVDDVFHHAFDRGEFVLDAFNPYGRDGKAL